MNVFVIPSWYPTKDHPYTGIFFKEQAEIFARHKSNSRIGISTWGSHEEKLLLYSKRPFESLRKALNTKSKPHIDKQTQNLTEYYNPAFTWTRKLFSGNIQSIIKANEVNLSQFIKENGKPDVLHAHVSYPAGWIAMELSRIYKIPYLITEHMSPFPLTGFISNGKIDSVIKEPLLRADRILAVSLPLKERLKNLGFFAHHFPNFIEDDFFVPGEQIKNSKAFTFLNIGRLSSQKGQAYLIKAASLLLEKGYDFRIKIVGSGELLDTLKSEVAALHLQKQIEFIPSLSRREINEALQKSDCFILPSLHENLPVSILEALACGVPIISTSCGGPEEMINDNTGLLVPPANAGRLCEAMLTMIENHNQYSSIKIRQFFTEQYGTLKLVDQLADHYQGVINHK